MDLIGRSLAALDWQVVLDALSARARTRLGAARALLPAFFATLPEVEAAYAAVLEVQGLEVVGDRVPVGSVTDIGALLEGAARGSNLDGGELRSVRDCLLALRHLRTWVDERAEPLPELRRLVLPIVVDLDLSETLRRSFDDSGSEDTHGLSEKEYPELGQLRRQVEFLRARIQRTLDELIGSGGLGDALMDRFVTQRDGRFVIPVKAERRRGLGIVHGRSQSGETVYVEPAAVVELHNELDEAESDLRREIHRILGVLTRMVGRFRAPLLLALEAAVVIDLCCARADLGRALSAVVPRIGAEGVLDLRQARHPVLALRGVEVVANDLRLDGRCPGLVLSGPNTGGKTVALKTMGLAALMVRAAIPVPCREGSRVDLFDAVLADAGDWQSVEGDLSTFSGHVEILRAILGAVQGAGTLVLLDEIGMGTDPSQGAALARAVLETLVDRGARVAATTHYMELKALAAVDPRFQVAAVAIEEGRPTYQVLMGAAGESHALAIAARLKLPAEVVARARSLLGAHQRELSDLVLKLEEERAGLFRLRREADAIKAELAQRSAALAQQEARLDERRAELEHRVSERFQARLKAREHELKGLIAALQEQPDLRLAGRTLAQLRETLQEARVPAPAAPVGPPPAVLHEGDSVLVRSLGKKGVVSRLLKGDQVAVRVGAMEIKVDRTDLEGSRGERFVAEAVVAVPPVEPATKKARKDDPAERFGQVRIPANTCDLRGQRVDEALDRLDRFLAELAQQGFDQGWILHGHGTGQLKLAVRRFLPGRPEVRKWRPGNAGEGGDAYTVVEL